MRRRLQLRAEGAITMLNTMAVPNTAPDMTAAALFDRAAAYQESGDHDSALSLLEQLIDRYPCLATLHLKQGSVFWAARKYHHALHSFDRAIALDDENAEAHFCKATALQALGQAESALKCYDTALAIRPDYVEALNNKAVLLKETGRVEDALRTYGLATNARPDCTQAWVGKSLCELLLGNFNAGWQAYEWRRKVFGPLAKPSPAPYWRGEPLAGKTLLIQAEQGLGDTIQFCRYATIASRAGADVILQAPDRLLKLLSTLGSSLKLIGTSEPTPITDYHVMLLSMPGLYWSTHRPCSNDAAYLAPDPALTALWRNRIGDRGFRIGIHWQGEKKWEGIDKASDRERSFSVLQFRPIAELPGIRLISLQKNDGLEQLKELPRGLHIEEPGHGFDDGPDAFADSAAIIANLDLVITSDTALAHLAGALGCRTWLALQHVPDWRWQLGSPDTFWYPNTKLFRQPDRGNWPAVFREMRGALTQISSMR